MQFESVLKEKVNLILNEEHSMSIDTINELILVPSMC